MPILIASSVLDHDCVDAVVNYLQAKNREVLVYQSDSVANGQHDFSVRIAQDGQVRISYCGEEIEPSRFTAAWYRRPNNFGLTNDHLRSYSLGIEYKKLQQFLWQSVPDAAWLNHPEKVYRAEDKFNQLVVAKKMGFGIPETVVSNSWQPITKIQADSLTFKMPALSRRLTPQGLMVMYSKILENRPTTLPLDSLPYPGIWQTHIPKKREWRITVVGEQVFSTAIYTSKGARDDWRKHQLITKAVQFVDEPVPDVFAHKCIRYTKKFGLVYGAFDFIETPDGSIIFLEMNPNGQYSIDKTIPDPHITQAIGEKLIQLDEKNRH